MMYYQICQYYVGAHSASEPFVYTALRCSTLNPTRDPCTAAPEALSIFSNDVKPEAERVQVSAETVVSMALRANACSDLAEAQRTGCMRSESLLSQADRALFVFHSLLLGDA
jgi:hypothetical protein